MNQLLPFVIIVPLQVQQKVKQEKQRVLFVQQVPLVTCVLIVLKDGIVVTKMPFALDVKLDITQKIVDKPSVCRVMRVNMLEIKRHTIVPLVLKVSNNRKKGNLCVYLAIQEPMLKKKTR
jgi:hypothetical protein